MARYKIVIDDLIKPESCVMGKQFKMQIKLHMAIAKTADDSVGYRLAFKLGHPKGRFTGAIDDKRIYETLPTTFNDEGGID